MLSARFSTSNVASADQADAWHGWFWPVFDVAPKASPDDGYLARNDVWVVGGLVVSRVAAPPATVVRTRANLANAPADHWVLSCCRKGVTSIETNGYLLRAGPREAFLWSLGEASYSERTGVDRIQIMLPRDLFPEIRTQLDALRGSVLTKPEGTVLGEYLMALSRWLPKLAPETQPRLATSIGNMISACLVPNADNLERAKLDVSAFLMDRVRRVVQMHLRSSSLGPEALCKMVGMSRSSLYRLFIYEGGIMHYIQRQRLLHAYAALSDPLNRQTILAISEDLCFSDATSFSRAFRREFGSSPTDVRHAAVTGNPIPPLSLPRETQGTETFADFLRARFGRAV
jgi:AraC-type DNA-binding domain-containing proteins